MGIESNKRKIEYNRAAAKRAVWNEFSWQNNL
jgi:hypothetical protein